MMCNICDFYVFINDWLFIIDYKHFKDSWAFLSFIIFLIIIYYSPVFHVFTI